MGVYKLDLTPLCWCPELKLTYASLDRAKVEQVQKGTIDLLSGLITGLDFEVGTTPPQDVAGVSVSDSVSAAVAVAIPPKIIEGVNFLINFWLNMSEEELLEAAKIDGKIDAAPAQVALSQFKQELGELQQNWKDVCDPSNNSLEEQRIGMGRVLMDCNEILSLFNLRYEQYIFYNSPISYIMHFFSFAAVYKTVLTLAKEVEPSVYGRKADGSVPADLKIQRLGSLAHSYIDRFKLERFSTLAVYQRSAGTFIQDGVEKIRYVVEDKCSGIKFPELWDEENPPPGSKGSELMDLVTYKKVLWTLYDCELIKLFRLL